MLITMIVMALAMHAVTPGSVRGPAAAPEERSAKSDQQQADRSWPPVGVFRPGPSVTAPKVTKEVRVSYTPDALRARVQGGVALEAVVRADGTVGEVRVVRSLDKQYGLDDAAVSALKQWQFTPGQKDGSAVPVLVDVEMTFSTRK